MDMLHHTDVGGRKTRSVNAILDEKIKTHSVSEFPKLHKGSECSRKLTYLAQRVP